MCNPAYPHETIADLEAQLDRALGRLERTRQRCRRLARQRAELRAEVTTLRAQVSEVPPKPLEIPAQVATEPVQEAAPLTFGRCDRRTLDLLRQLARGRGAVTCPTATVADHLGVSVRATQLRLQRLGRMGLVNSVSDYSLRSRRRLVLVKPEPSKARPVEAAV